MALNVTRTDSSSDGNTSSPAVPSATGSASASPTAGHSKGNSTGAIAGGVVGGVVALAIFIGGFIYYRRRRSRKASEVTQLAEDEAIWTRKELPTTERPRYEADSKLNSQLEASSRSELAGAYWGAHELPAGTPNRDDGAR